MSKKRILVVDDEPSITRLLKLNLEQTGSYEVRVENLGASACSPQHKETGRRPATQRPTTPGLLRALPS